MVSLELKEMFGTYNVELSFRNLYSWILENNSGIICPPHIYTDQRLNVAMERPYGPKLKLKLSFTGSIGDYQNTMKALLLKYKDNITQLSLPVNSSDGYLLEANFKFPQLQSVNIKVFGWNLDYYTKVQKLLKNLFSIYSNKLVHIGFSSLRQTSLITFITKNLTLPNLKSISI